MLENMFLQASGLGTCYESKIFKNEEISLISEFGVKNAVAAMLLKIKNDVLLSS